MEEEKINKPFIVANVRDLMLKYQHEEISFSRMVEILNEMAFSYTASQVDDIKQVNEELNKTIEKLRGMVNWNEQLNNLTK